MHSAQPDLPLFLVKPGHPNVELLVDTLARRNEDWLLASEILAAWGVPDTEHNRRFVRALAEASEGRVVGGQHGYKLTTACTGQEYNHWRNAMKSQADKMTARILQADRVFYARRPVSSGVGILQPGTAVNSDT